MLDLSTRFQIRTFQFLLEYALIDFRLQQTFPIVSPTGLSLDPATYIQDFFSAGHEYIDALTWHQYYLKGSTAKVADFVNPTIMDTFKKQVTPFEIISHVPLFNSMTLRFSTLSHDWPAGQMSM